MSVTLNENDVRELQWVADVLVAAANGDQPDQGYEQAAKDLAEVVKSKLPRPVEPVKAGDILTTLGRKFIAVLNRGEEGYVFLDGASAGRFHRSSFAHMAEYERSSL